MKPRALALVIAALPACSAGDVTLPSEAAPASLIKVAGDGQRASTGSWLPDPLVVKAVDSRGRPVEGAAVVFRFAGSVPGAVTDPDTAVTDGTGQASAQARLGTASGGQRVVAAIAGSDPGPSVEFQVTALAPPPPKPPDDGPGGGGGGGGGKGKGKGKGDKGDDD